MEVTTEAQVTEDRITVCVQRLLDEIPGPVQPRQRAREFYRKHSVVKEDSFIEYMLSVIYVESRFRADAKSDKDAIGLMQMTGIAIEAAVKNCNLHPVGDIRSLFDIATNVKYGSCYLKKVLEEADGDWTRALILYNGGYKQLTKYDRGDTINHETSNYVLQVERARKICRGRTQGDIK